MILFYKFRVNTNPPSVILKRRLNVGTMEFRPGSMHALCFPLKVCRLKTGEPTMVNPFCDVRNVVPPENWERFLKAHPAGGMVISWINLPEMLN